MKVLFIESRLKNQTYTLTDHDLKILPKELFLAYSIQYKDLAESILAQLKANNIKIKAFRQVFGCSKIKNSLPVLFIGKGRFHAKNLYFQAPRIFVVENSIIEIPRSEIEQIEKKRKGALLNYFNANKVGILLSTKPGQTIGIDACLRLKSKLEKKGKLVYIFISNNIDLSQFENFNIDSWVNTACTGLSYDNPKIIDISELNL